MTEHTDTSNSSEIDALFPPEVTLTLAGEQFTLKAFPAKHLRPYLSVNRRLLDKARQLGADIIEAKAVYARYVEAKAKWLAEGGAKPAAPDLGGIPSAIVERPLTEDGLPVDLLHERCYEEYRDLVLSATGKPLAWVEELGIDELVTAAQIVNALNASRYQSKK